ncbi:MAG: hypothetical protein GQ572_09720 [Gammaproteobacteria bacterium]|nr:hypothetical protein [Gammaproteobacteria bacterium]
MFTRINLRPGLFVILFMVVFSVRADWMNLTGAETSENIAEIYVFDNHVKVKLEVYFGDLDKFDELLPDEWLKVPVSDRPSLEQRLHTFATEHFQLITDKGVKLPAMLELVEPRQRVDRQSPYAGMINPMTRQRVKEAPADKRVLYAEIRYPFSGQQPKSLTIVPPLNERGIVTSNIGFVVYHQAVPVIDFRYLGQPATLNLNWQDPWYSKFDNKNLTRHHKYPLMLYLYVEPRQVRLESLMRISDISEMTGFDVDELRLNETDKFQQLQKHIKSYYSNDNTLQIDKHIVQPGSVRVEFLTVTLKGLKVIDNAPAVDESSLLVGVSLQYSIETLPQNIKSKWFFFNQRVDRIPVIVTDPAGPLLSLIDKDDPDFGWKNFLKTYREPVIRPVDIKTGWRINIPYLGEKKLFNQLPDLPQATSIVDAVFENVRTVFIEKDPNSFSRQLAKVSVQTLSSEQAGIIKNELSKLFAANVTGGGVSSVQSFDELQLSHIRSLDDPNGFSVTVSGKVNISAKHWGHIDQRQFQFQLLLDLIEVKQQWRLVDITIIDIKEAK